jgi:hypothetical protein
LQFYWHRHFTGGSVHVQLIYTDEVVEVEISKGSSDANKTQFYAPPEVQVAAGLGELMVESWDL